MTLVVGRWTLGLNTWGVVTRKSP